MFQGLYYRIKIRILWFLIIVILLSDLEQKKLKLYLEHLKKERHEASGDK